MQSSPVRGGIFSHPACVEDRGQGTCASISCNLGGWTGQHCEMVWNTRRGGGWWLPTCVGGTLAHSPTGNPQTPPQTSPSVWQRDPRTDTGAGGGTAGNGACDGTEECIYTDQVTGLSIAKSDLSFLPADRYHRAEWVATERTWTDAIAYCAGLSYGDATDWRLASEEELAKAWQSSGSLGVFTKLGFDQQFWTSTQDPANSAQARSILAAFPPEGMHIYHNSDDKNLLRPVACVRP